MRRCANRGKSSTHISRTISKERNTFISDVLPLGLFKLMKPYIDQINNIRLVEEIMYSKNLTLAGQVDCVAEYNGKLSVIDFKTK